VRGRWRRLANCLQLRCKTQLVAERVVCLVGVRLLGVLDCEEAPFAGDAFQFVGAAVLEGEA
jgi:hypothetical protein